MKKIIPLALLLITAFKLQAQQVDISTDLRERFEFRNGFNTLVTDTSKPAVFITQRSRLIFDYTNNKIKLRFAPQNVRVWGDVINTSRNDLGNVIYEAWAELNVSKKVILKAGRQELNYDDSRIFGNLDWVMQGRSHDILVAKITPYKNSQLHAGVAYNANRETNFNENYLVAQYKTMHYLWYHTDIKKIGVSLLAINNGMPYLKSGKEHLSFTQISGTRITYKATKLTANFACYFQTGKLDSNTINASYVAADFLLKPAKGISTGLGFEYISGKAGDDVSPGYKSFNPMYGTNHKFNGFMDYFYVGNHVNNVGLIDGYMTLAYEKNKFTGKLVPHYFSSAATVYKAGKKYNSYLGSEIDLMLIYKLWDDVKLEAGYSQMLATSTMEIVKRGGSSSKTNNWAYFTLYVNPKILSQVLEKKQ